MAACLAEKFADKYGEGVKEEPVATPAGDSPAAKPQGAIPAAAPQTTPAAEPVEPGMPGQTCACGHDLAACRACGKGCRQVEAIAEPKQGGTGTPPTPPKVLPKP